VVHALCDLVDELRPDLGGSRSLLSFVADRAGHDRRYAVDAARAAAELGWQPRRTFEEGLRETVRWYLDHRAWCERITSGVYRRERLGMGGG
jgi:dTDP-glucose 4,6-dehydratase